MPSWPIWEPMLQRLVLASKPILWSPKMGLPTRLVPTAARRLPQNYRCFSSHTPTSDFPLESRSSSIGTPPSATHSNVSGQTLPSSGAFPDTCDTKGGFFMCSSTGQMTRSEISDAVMGILSRYAAAPVQDLELTTPLTSLETVTGHEAPEADVCLGGTPEKATFSPRVWDCLDTVEFLLDVEAFFKVQIPDAIADAVKTPEDAVIAVVDLLKERNLFKDVDTAVTNASSPSH